MAGHPARKKHGKIFHPVLRGHLKKQQCIFQAWFPGACKLESNTMNNETEMEYSSQSKIMFCHIFSATTYISDQVTRNTVLPLSVPYQRHSMHKYPEDMQVQSKP